MDPDTPLWSVVKSSYNHWPPLCALTYFAGVYTAQLLNLLGPDHPLRRWRGWRVADLLLLLLFFVPVAIKGSEAPMRWYSAARLNPSTSLP